ncbi:response regulator [Flavisolibacter tropicus]|uniref:histidine kinase n=1 Tax=Flavisolibacter tropicus TaxID=1492898 RepID=A0A172TXI6_9BACT|nr:response regulator [Flavisolibacter tropicus]ANE51447.1 histidine kinase [Flavisolibacter tropicus]
MKRLLQRLPLPTKLMLLGLLPLLFLLAVSYQLYKSRDEKLALVDNYRQRVDLAININNLAEQLQKERRYAFGFALQGTWHNEMLAERQQTDAALQKLLTENGAGLPGFTSYTFLDQLKAFRARLDNKQADAGEILNFYTNIIFRLSNQNNVAVGNNLYLRPIIKDLAGQKILSDIITYEGIVRAQVYLMLQTQQSNPQLISSVIQTQSIIDAFSKEFFIASSPQSIQDIKALQSDADVKAMGDYLNKLAKTKSLDTSVSAEYWWNVSANAIDRVMEVQQKMVSRVKQGIDNLYTHEEDLQRWNIILLLAMLFSVVSLILFITRSISNTLTSLREAAQTIAKGKTGITIQAETNDVVAALARSIIAIDTNNKQLTQAADAIGRGDFSVPIHPRSDEDLLGNAIIEMKGNLEVFTRSNEEKIWIQTGIAAVNDAIRGEKDLPTLCKDALQTVIEYLGCENGLLYVAQEDELLYKAGYAISSVSLVPQRLHFGETLVGQAALRKEMTVLENVPDDFIKIRTAAGTAAPKQVLLIPLVNDNQVEGVIEASSLQGIQAYKLDFLKDIATDIAIALQVTKNKTRLQELFEEVQTQAEELQSQHRELEALNAELEMNTQRLQASEEELKVQQEELMQANQELEERSKLLEERNQIIQQRNLEIQRKAEELEISTKYKSEFLANMSHELRTPLNSILLLSRLLAENNEKTLTSDQVEYAQVIQSSGSGLLSLIDEILDLSKIEAGKMELEFAPTAVRDMTSGLRSLFAPMAKEKGIDFNVQIEPSVPALIETDRMRLEQILKNLLSNALKFTTQGAVDLSVSTLSERPSFIRFSVKDTGIGIPQEKQQAVFEAFQQADGSTRRRFGGTGLGLSISRELVRILGGEIKLTSEVGQGSEFTLFIPTHKTEVASTPPIEPIVTTPVSHKINTPEESLSVKRKRYIATEIPAALPDDRTVIKPQDKVILIIEDDAGFAKALLDYTRTKGYKGLVAVRGDEGIELAKQFKPIGILLDLQLPVKDGWEVMEALKSAPQTRHIPVHMMSSHAVKRESLMKGAVDFINKPVAFEQMQEIFQKIEHVLNKEYKKVLIVEENSKHAKALAYFLETFQVNAEVSNNISESVDALEKESVDCVILDMGVPDNKSYDTLEEIKKRSGLEHLPIIIFTGKSLSTVEESKIKQYADSIVVKTAHSYQRILDEVSLFLHLIEENNGTQQKASFQKLGALEDVLRNKKILITDDDVRNIFSLTKALEKHNMQVLSAIDGKEALRMLNQHPDIDVVLMDIMMPEMDGYETMKQIRATEHFRKLPIIAVTAKAMTGDREKCIKAGASDYISKPVDIDQLLSLLRVWLYDTQ